MILFEKNLFLAITYKYALIQFIDFPKQIIQNLNTNWLYCRFIVPEPYIIIFEYTKAIYKPAGVFVTQFKVKYKQNQKYSSDNQFLHVNYSNNFKLCRRIAVILG